MIDAAPSDLVARPSGDLPGLRRHDLDRGPVDHGEERLQIMAVARTVFGRHLPATKAR